MPNKIDVLLVDDSADIRGFISDELKTRGLRVAEANHGQEALREIENLRPTLVLTDIHMPVMDGIEFLKQAREKFPHLPIYFMTGGSHYSRSEILALGATECFDKIDLLKIVTFLSDQFEFGTRDRT